MDIIKNSLYIGLYLQKPVLFIAAILLIYSNIEAQDTFSYSKDNINGAKIEWYKTINGDEVTQQSNILKKLGDFIFGNDKPLFSRPISIYASDTSDIWIADQGYGDIIHLGIKGNQDRRQSRQREELLPSLASICGFQGNEILITDSSLEKIYRKSANSPLSLFSDTLTLLQPTGLALNFVTDEIWVIETRGHRVSIIDRSGKKLKLVGERGSEVGQFNYPTHIWIDWKGDVFIVDAMNFRIQKFDSDGNFLFSFGEQGDATGYFARPKGIATDSKGNIYIADALFNVIQVFSEKGEFLYYFGGQGVLNGEFWMPGGIYVDKQDFLYIADSYNSRIQIFKISHHDK